MLTHAETATHRDREISVRTDKSRILVVRHGVGRGPRIRFRGIRPAHCEPLFDSIAARWPDVSSRLSFWETGSPQPDVSDVAAIVFLVQDPLRELYPDCFADAVKLARRGRKAGARIVNAPESLSNTIKTTQARLWRDAGLPTPPCIPFDTIDKLHSAAAEIKSPMIIKADTLHAQKRSLVIPDLESLLRIPSEQIPLPGALSPIVDTRAGYAKLDPHSPYATHYHKKRAMVFGDHVCHNHVFFSDQPIVGCLSSTFGHFRSVNPVRRTIGNARCRSHIEYDLRYHDSNCDDAETLALAAKVLGVEFCAIDYSTHADGRIVLWETNPFFSLHRWPIGVLSRQRQLRRRIPKIHETAALFLRDLLSNVA